jgi:hypothetical protein
LVLAEHRDLSIREESAVLSTTEKNDVRWELVRLVEVPVVLAEKLQRELELIRQRQTSNRVGDQRLLVD